MNEITFPLSKGMQGATVADLQQALDTLGFTILLFERTPRKFHDYTEKAVTDFQRQFDLQATGAVDEVTARKLNELLAGAPTFTIEGKVIMEHGLPANKLKLRLYRRDFGGKSTLLNEAKSTSDGAYSFSYKAGKSVLSLEVRAVNSDTEETLLTKPLNNLKPQAVLNLLAPSSLQALAGEYARLSADLTPHIGQMSKLAEAQENTERQDLTVLNRATGWDARLIALAANTEQLIADPEVALPQEGVYGLLRMGLPSDKLLLAQTEADVVEQTLKKARDAGIVELTDAAMGDFKKLFSTFSNALRINTPAPGSHSTYAMLLEASGLPQNVQKDFISIYFNHEGDTEQLWEAASDAGISDSDINTLKLQGKFAFLAGNSEAMATRLLDKQINDPVQLVEQSLYQADAWMTEVFEQAGIPQNRHNNLNDVDKKNLEQLIPAAFESEKLEDRLQAYTEDMARKVRLSYPTQVIGRLMETDDAFQLSMAHNATLSLLKNAEKKGFRLGETPVVNFLKSQADATTGIPPSELETAQLQLQMVQRVYQISPDNESMSVLMMMDTGSAYDVTMYTEAQFISLFENKYFEYYHKLPQTGMARRLYRKAEQVNTVTYNLFTIASKMESDPAFAGISAPESREEVKNNLIKHFPTMESLFGSMDYCACEHCRSVLSPAAYFVDLLQFIDPESLAWGGFLEEWKTTHNNEDYPHPKPYDVLIERRPDLPHISLSCENTNTALPYIDIVNEILEYYVANERLEAEAVRDTGDATTSELLAEPQNVIQEAYEKVREARYPLNLPFDLWIETVRQFSNYFEAPLEKVLETFRKSDDLFAPAQSFDRASIFMESLGFSPAELAIFIDKTPLANWYELYGFSSESDAVTEAINVETGQRIDLNSAKSLSRRLGVTYKEIVDIVQTGFVNPQLVHMHLLYKLGVSIRDARFYLDHKALIGQDPDTLSVEEQRQQLEVLAFVVRLEQYAEGLSSDTLTVTSAILESDLLAIPFDEVLVLADPDAGCNFDLTILQYADATTKAKPIDFLRINLFVRLWRKLGWSIEETDRILTSFIPQSVPYDEIPGNLDKQPFKTALIYIAHLQQLNEKVGMDKQSLLKLITLWSDIATTGKQPLYTQLFLSHSMLKTNPVFDHPLGQYLADDSNVDLKLHLLALQGSLALTATEIDQILVDSDKSLEGAKLTLSNVSLLYRYRLFAKALKLSVTELIILKQLSGLEPFKAIHPDPLVNIEDDYPFSHTLRFVEIAAKIKESSLKIEDLDYLLRHRFDETGKYRVDPNITHALLKTLSEGVSLIRAEHALPDDSGALSEEVLRQKLGLALAPDVADRFLAMMNGTVEFTATKAGVAEADKFPAEIFAGELAVREVSYNKTRQEQQITFRGVLFDAKKIALVSRFSLPNLNDLLDDIQQQGQEFFEKYLQKQALGVQSEYGFLDAMDFDLLFDKEFVSATVEAEQDRVRKQQTRLAETFLPYLQQRLINQFIIQTMTSYTAADSAMIESLVTDKRLLAQEGSDALMSVLAASSVRGVDAEFFESEDLSDIPQLGKYIVRSADMVFKHTDDAAGHPLSSANSARFEGYLEVPELSAYRFYVELDKLNAEAKLRFDHLSDSLFLEGTATSDNTTLGEEADKYIELQPGITYRFTLELRNLNGGGARLLVQGETLPKDSLSHLTVYPLSTINNAENAVLLLNKALLIVQSLGLSEREIRYLLTHAIDFSDVSLSQYPTRSVGNTDTEKAATIERFKQFLRLMDYALLKHKLAGDTEGLIDIFEANAITDTDKLAKHVYPLLAKLTHYDETTVKNTAEEALATSPDFANEIPLIRLWEALQFVGRFGVPVASLQGWMQIVNADATPEQRFEIARDLKEVIKAHFEPENWLRVAQPIFDKLRQYQRDALVSHVLHQQGFDRIEQLYEYFLIDPGMEPVVQTSRIRLAISSLQLFIQRSLLNLEKKVNPSTITSSHWEWMKRYRVWEANRKIFLFPENWLEPEFRDDKTHLFNELEGALLQGDVSSDLVEDAFLNYLKKLDELARLEIVAMHIEDDPEHRILHVFGRTYSQPHKHFYRRYKDQMWTPWEPVSAEVQGDHLAPVVWRDRLYLFWVTFMDKPDENAQTGSTSGNLINATLSQIHNDLQAASEKKQIDVQLHWSEYLKGEWSTRESGEYVAAQGYFTRKELGFPRDEYWMVPHLITHNFPINFDLKKIFVHVTKQYDNGEEQGVYIHLNGGWFRQAFYLAGRNSPPKSVPLPSTILANPYTSITPFATRYSSSGHLKVKFDQKIITEPGKEPIKEPVTLAILQKGKSFSLLPCNNKLKTLSVSSEVESLIKPLFYQDNHHTLFVEPNVTEKTIETWDKWVDTPRITGSGTLGRISVANVLPEIPRGIPIPDELLKVLEPPIDLGPVINSPGRDWLVNPATVVNFGGVLIGSSGQVGVEILPTSEHNPASHLVAEGVAPLVDEFVLEESGLLDVTEGINVVGNDGFSSILERNLDNQNFGRRDGLSGLGRILR